MFKNETHNHPTEIEPFGGAATCLGGGDPRSAFRPVLCLPGFAADRQRRSETVPVDQTLAGKTAARGRSRQTAARWILVLMAIRSACRRDRSRKCVPHPGYIAKRMEIGAVIGAAAAQSRTESCSVEKKRPATWSSCFLAGEPAAMAAAARPAHPKNLLIKAVDHAQCGSEVQKGNPPTERKIQRLFRDPSGVSCLIRRCNDFGAGGVEVAIGELTDGLKIDLDLVPRKYEGLDGTELAISESQERMAICCRPQRTWAAFIAARPTGKT